MPSKDVSDVTNQVFDLIYGRWRSQTLYAGVELGVFDHLTGDCAKQAEAVAAELHVDAALLYRLMRALASLGLLIENDARDFATSEPVLHTDTARPEMFRFEGYTLDIARNLLQTADRELALRPKSLAPEYRQALDQWSPRPAPNAPMISILQVLIADSRSHDAVRSSAESTPMSGYFPPIEPYDSGMLDGGDGHQSIGNAAGTALASRRSTCMAGLVRAARQVSGGSSTLISTVRCCLTNAGLGAADRWQVNPMPT